MPRGDKTGPRGEGPRTGRGQGNCKTTKTNNGGNSKWYLPRRGRNGFGGGRGNGKK